jgi:CRISPR system Cascade subunit CasD
MPTLLLQLAGPMQSWGTRSRFDERDTDLEPSKSAVIGLLCAALGVNRFDTKRTQLLADLIMGVRVDREGTLRYDYQTAQSFSARGAANTVQTWRYYLADAVFLVGLESNDAQFLEEIQNALEHPHWSLSLGRKSYLPSPGVWLPNGLRQIENLRNALEQYPYLPALDFELQQDILQPIIDPKRLPKPDTQLRVILESNDGTGSLRMDQPISNFADRKFGARFVNTTTFTPAEVRHVPE